jgi:hypothetical protein
MRQHLNMRVGSACCRDSVRWEWEHGMAADNADLRISLVWRFQEVDA